MKKMILWIVLVSSVLQYKSGYATESMATSTRTEIDMQPIIYSLPV